MNLSGFNPKFTQYFLPVLLGFIIMYLPTYRHASEALWATDDQSHGPIILLLVLYLIWLRREALYLAVESSKPMHTLGWLFFSMGAFFYIIGRSQDILIFDLGSQIPIVVGLSLLVFGYRFLRIIVFPIFFMLFLLPIPAALLAAITLPMKIAVSIVVDNVLFHLGYPIARDGVILQIGQYQLMVADACAGMNTLISLEALGLLYLNLVKHDSLARNLILATLIVPISFTANVIRVISLTLITYYFGNEVGQGFIHGFAGIVLFTVALILILSVDHGIQWWLDKRKQNKDHNKNAKV
jgi:exosortase B